MNKNHKTATQTSINLFLNIIQCVLPQFILWCYFKLINFAHYNQQLKGM